MQPLDLSVFVGFKKRKSQSQANWLRSHTGRPMQIYDLPEIVCNSWNEFFTIQNVVAGFAKVGIYFVNPDIFQTILFYQLKVQQLESPTNVPVSVDTYISDLADHAESVNTNVNEKPVTTRTQIIQ
ncbi:hypothetical protein SNE40_019624 [Patella caerulea]